MAESIDMTTLNVRPNSWQRLLQRIPATRWGAHFFARFLHHVDPAVMRWSGGRVTLPSLLIGVPIVMLTSTGARSRRPRTMPVIGIPDGENIVLVASNWGQRRNPGWYYNLRANPGATLEFGGDRGEYRAQEITDPAQYQHLWRKASEVYLGFQHYQKRAAQRQIPIILLRPQQPAAQNQAGGA